MPGIDVKVVSTDGGQPIDGPVVEILAQPVPPAKTYTLTRGGTSASFTLPTIRFLFTFRMPDRPEIKLGMDVSKFPSYQYFYGAHHELPTTLDLVKAPMEIVHWSAPFYLGLRLFEQKSQALEAFVPNTLVHTNVKEDLKGVKVTNLVEEVPDAPPADDGAPADLTATDTLNDDTATDTQAADATTDTVTD